MSKQNKEFLREIKESNMANTFDKYLIRSVEETIERNPNLCHNINEELEERNGDLILKEIEENDFKVLLDKMKSKPSLDEIILNLIKESFPVNRYF